MHPAPLQLCWQMEVSGFGLSHVARHDGRQVEYTWFSPQKGVVVDVADGVEDVLSLVTCVEDVLSLVTCVEVVLSLVAWVLEVLSWVT
jgi:hypothetical protein